SRHRLSGGTTTTHTPCTPWCAALRQLPTRLPLTGALPSLAGCAVGAALPFGHDSLVLGIAHLPCVPRIADVSTCLIDDGRVRAVGTALVGVVLVGVVAGTHDPEGPDVSLRPVVVLLDLGL